VLDNVLPHPPWQDISAGRWIDGCDNLLCPLWLSDYRDSDASAGKIHCSCLVYTIIVLIFHLNLPQKSTEGTLCRLLRFYTDRFVRLTPALLVMMGITYTWHILEHHNMVENNKYALLSLFYLGNVKSLWPQSSYTGPWGNTWSLACEEQYYIIWSLSLPFLLKRSTRTRAVLLGGVMAYFIVLRVWTSIYAGSFYGTDWRYGLWANMWKMLAGSSLRLLPVPSWLCKKTGAYLGLLGLMVTLLLTLAPQPSYESIAPGWKNPLGPIQAWVDLFSVVFTGVILCGVSGGGGGIAILEGAPIRFLGRVSYSWYLWQVPLLTLSGWRKVYPAVADTALALVLATCSTLWVEEPLRKFVKSRRSPSQSM
jgi:peptidoglycan/LPS O-acetylase OafA/YrhL